MTVKKSTTKSEPKATKSAEPAEPAEPAEAKTLKDAAAAGTVRLFRQRKNGTLRSLTYLAPGSAARKEAETVAARREKGEIIGSITDDLNVSVATVRRMITNLLLAEQIEAGEHADKFKPGDMKVIISAVGDAA